MASHERTPLLQVVVVAPPRPRYTHHGIRRACSVFLGCSLAVAVVLFLLPDSFGLPYLPWARHCIHRDGDCGHGMRYEDLQNLLLSTPAENRVREWSRYYTSGPHLAGKNLSQAIWTKDRWQEFGVKDSKIISYETYVNYPVAHRLALLENDSAKHEGSSRHRGVELDISRTSWKVKYEASLEEDVLEEDQTSGLNDRIPTFHGYSASGNVTAPYVFVNYGSWWDYEDLRKANVTLEGKIALIKYGTVFRGLKVKRAEELGMIGAIIYSDPGDDGNVTVENGVAPYPKGPARQPSSVQRGSVQFLSVAPGDPTTPGYPSKPGVPRQDPHGCTPSIPSIPISYEDAIPLLKALNGHGPKASSINEHWRKGGLGYRGVEYNVGPTPDSLVVNLYNEQDYVTTPIWNVIGIVNGSLSDEVVIIGNHRDAWVAGGAGDPNGGSAALNEVVRSFGAAVQRGWKPLRTIVFASWDGEEYGLLGSTEWVEEYLPWLSKSTVAYLNVDIGTIGSSFTAAASPLLNSVLYEVTSLVPSPNQTVKGQTIRDTWDGHIRTMGSGSDFTAFQDFAGIPSLDMAFDRQPDSPVYHYHSNYDSFNWMSEFGDNGWHYHVTIAKLWALITARLVETPVIGFNTTDYTLALKTYLERAKHLSEHVKTTDDDVDSAGHAVSFHALEDALDHLLSASVEFDAHASKVAERIRVGVPWWKWWEKAQLSKAVKKINRRYKYFERQFLYPRGLDGRSWFKHVVFAPGLWTGYSGATFPGLVENIQSRDWKSVQRWCDIIKLHIDSAAGMLSD